MLILPQMSQVSYGSLPAVGLEAEDMVTEQVGRALLLSALCYLSPRPGANRGPELSAPGSPCWAALVLQVLTSCPVSRYHPARTAEEPPQVKAPVPPALCCALRMPVVPPLPEGVT